MHFRGLSLLLATTVMAVAQATLLTINFHPFNINDSPYGVVITNADCDKSGLSLPNFDCKGDTCEATHGACIRSSRDDIGQANEYLDRTGACYLEGSSAKRKVFDNFRAATRGDRCLFSVQQDRSN